ncbi:MULTISPECIES: amino acid permease [unclassified Minwuia]|jgi:basic amino acid/polyamine antiporter, APA family|uniref:APC family permease n=1 Tax=unclassified Minwuia TaxID=2618799 RepID=UPI00247AFE20|nr:MULTISPECIES: amino acid permease [unclassified Minwuia]
MALHRRVGLSLLILYGVGVMVGAGIYVLVGKVAGVAGALTPLSFVVAGVAAALSALSFAELSARIPESAGEAAYVRTAFGIGWFGDCVGVAVACVGVISAAAILKGGVGYLAALVDLPRFWLEILVGLLLGCIALVGVLESLVFAAILTLIEIVGLLLIVGAGFSAEPVTPLADMVDLGSLLHGGGPMLLAAALLAFFAFIGFEDMVNLAEETIDPVRTMPRGIVGAIMITTLLYVLVAVAAIRAVDMQQLAQSERPLALVFEKGTGWSPDTIIVIAIFATLNGVLAQIVMAARVLYGLGRRNRLFTWAHATSDRLGTPVAATVAVTLIVVVLALSAPIEKLAQVTTYILLCIFIVVNLALLALKRRVPTPAGAPDVHRTVPMIAILLSLVLLFA